MPESIEVLSYDSNSPHTSSEDMCVVLSEVAVAGVESLKSMRLLGQLQGKQMMILLNSGRSTSFISSQLATDLMGVSVLSHPLSIKVASGAHM
jgi:hypothetical protein